MKYLLLYLFSISILAGVVIPERDVDGRPTQSLNIFRTFSNIKLKATGVSGTALASTSTNIDLKLADTTFLKGLRIILKDHCVDDTIDFEVVDVDNVLGGGLNKVLNQFGFAWNVIWDKADQGHINNPYVSKVPANIYLRIKYISTCASNSTKVKINYYMYKKVI